MVGDSLEGQGSTCGRCESSSDGWGTLCPPGQLVCSIKKSVFIDGQCP